MSWNKTHSKALEEKVARLKNANHKIREELKQCYKKIAELQEAMNKTCEGCKHGTAYVGTDRKYCERGVQQDGLITVDKDFCCNRYVPKEKQ